MVGKRGLASEALTAFRRRLPLAPDGGRLKVLSPAELREDPVLLDPLVEPLQHTLEGFTFGQRYSGQTSSSVASFLPSLHQGRQEES